MEREFDTLTQTVKGELMERIRQRTEGSLPGSEYHGAGGPGGPRGSNWLQYPGTDYHPQWTLGIKALIFKGSTEFHLF